MKVASNKLSDIYKYYLTNLLRVYSDNEGAILLKRLIAFFAEIDSYKIPQMLDDVRVSESQLLKIHFGVKDLLKHKPLEYILEEVEFYEMKFKVNQNVLIPRPETEELVDLIWKNSSSSPAKPKLFDIGSGSGCIAICLSKLLNADTYAVDCSKEAIKIAKQNATTNCAEVKFIETDFLTVANWKYLPKKIDIIVSNPPYVRKSEKLLMKPNVLDYEPEKAIFVDDENPLIFYKAIADFAFKNLSEKGKIYLEINEFLAVETAEVFKSLYPKVKLINDLNGKKRFLLVEK